MPLEALGIDDCDEAHLSYSRGAVREDFVDTLRRDAGAVIGIPARRIAQQKINALPRPRGLFGERMRHVAELAIGCHQRLMIRAPSVISGGTTKGDHDEHAKPDNPKPQTPESD